MAKHRKHKRDYNTSYDEVNPGSGMNLNNLSSILGNIDINQIASLLNATGILGNLAPNQVSEDGSDTNQRESDLTGLNNIDFAQLLSQASNLNNMIMNNNEAASERSREKHGKGKGNKEGEERYTQQPITDDSVVMLLNAIKPMVNPERAQIIDKIVELYIQGKI
ncbi:hypothetical protein GOM49_03245 [Clostridium bovifaecis]|uniref:Uncharacterized protein n=1 Tax=Clostridium bovifaecis TaxID=2184719 RepID=A0A6I6EKR2_9CLOT|nr:hypothetical protein GOM49_03245 [Clostridium bovifaecis]